MSQEKPTEDAPKEFDVGPLLFPYLHRKVIDVERSKTRFVHYSSAEAAMSMIANAEVWMRKSRCMNDFSEIDHGWDCLIAAYRSESGQRLQKLLDDIFPGMRTAVEGLINGWQNHFYLDTYLTCISEHLDAEDRIGRLSMWRAYGGASGVAIVLNSEPFFNDPSDLNVTTSPVAYLDTETFAGEFEGIVSGLEKNREHLRQVPADWMQHLIFEMFRFAILCTKHPGFVEEREWRLIYQPSFKASQILKKSVQTVRGTPQPIVKFPLKDSPDHNLVGIEIPQLVNRVIIGPTNYPSAMKEAFTDLLESAGVPDAGKKVFISDIPLRV